MRSIITLFILGLLNSGCATTQRLDNNLNLPVSEIATVNIYRTKTLFHALDFEAPFIYMNNKVAAKLHVGKSETVHVPPGKYVFSAREPFLFMPSYKSGSFEYELKAGNTYYVRYSKEFGGLAGPANSPVVVGDTKFGLTTKENYELKESLNKSEWNFH